MNWDHPTGKAPKVVTLVSLGPSREDHCAALQGREPAPETECDEVWTLNRGVFHTPHDLLFVMDCIQGEAHSFPAYGAKLWRHDRPIITSDTHQGWPSHIHAFPFQAIAHWLESELKPIHSNWFHNSLAYILVYAGFIGVKILKVWGADYHHHRSGRVEDGHPNVAYWAAQMERVGMATTPCETSTFLGANQRDYIYGYRDDPREEAVNRRERFYQLVKGGG